MYESGTSTSISEGGRAQLEPAAYSTYKNQTDNHVLTKVWQSCVVRLSPAPARCVLARSYPTRQVNILLNLRSRRSQEKREGLWTDHCSAS